MPPDDIAVRVQTALHLMHGQRAIIAADHIVLARPEQLPGPVPACGFRDLGDFGGDMGRGLRAAAKAAAREHHVDLHIRWIDPQGGGQRRLVERRELRAHPKLRLAIRDLEHGIKRFKRGMGKIGKVELCLDHLRGPVDPRHGIANLFRGATAFGSGAREIRIDLRARPGFGFAVIPCHLQCFAPFKRGTGGLGIDRDPLRDFTYRDDTRYLQRVGIVKAGDNGTHFIGVRHDHRFHPLAVDIHRVFGLTGCLGMGVQLGHICADQGKILGLFQLGFGGGGHGCGFFSESAKACLGPVGVGYPSFQDRDLGRGHAPFGGGGINQHRAGGSAGLAHLHIAVRHRGGPACALQPEQRVGIKFVIGRRTFGTHLRPVGIQFLGHEGRKAGVRPLPEFDMFDQHRHRVIGGDTHKGVRRECGRIGRRVKGGRGTGLGARFFG